MKFKITIEYRGDSFAGWQVQDSQRTVQGELEAALRVLLPSEAKKQGTRIGDVPVYVQGSGRTDAGVHARGQTASFEWPDLLAMDAERLRGALNGITPRDLVVREAQLVPDEFDARFSAHYKLYAYRFLLRDCGAGLDDGRVWQVSPRGLNISEMVQAARLFTGQHDFSAFRAQDCNSLTTVRTILQSELARDDGDQLVLRLVGKGFLKQMVRIIAGTLLDVGRGKISRDQVAALLSGSSRSGAGQTAPAHGLTLEWVRYL